MSLPSGHEAREKDEWLALANDNDPAKRRLVSSCLRDMGVDPTDYMSWTAGERVDRIMEAQGDGGGSSAKEEKSSNGKGKGKSSAGKKTPAKSSSEGNADVAALETKIEKLEAMVEDIQETNGMLLSLVRDAHFLVRVLVQSNKQLKQNSEDEDLQEVLYDTLVVSGNGD